MVALNRSVSAWILACDRSKTSEVIAALHSHTDRVDPIVVPSAGEGAAAARNTALGLTSTRWVYALDADDIPMPRGVDRLLRAAAGHAWAAGFAVDYDRAGRTVTYVPPARLAPFGELVPVGGFRAVQEQTGVWPFLCSGATILSTDTARAVGGWDERLRVSEDVSLIAAINATETGGWAGQDHPVLGYRKHPGSVTAAGQDPVEEQAAFDLLVERADAATAGEPPPRS